MQSLTPQPDGGLLHELVFAVGVGVMAPEQLRPPRTSP